MKIQLSNQALDHLTNCLSLPGWCRSDNQTVSVKRTYLGGKILCDVLPPYSDSPLLDPTQANNPIALREHKKAILLWGKQKETPEFEMDDKMVEVCTVALKHFIGNGNTPTGGAMNELIDIFKIEL